MSQDRETQVAADAVRIAKDLPEAQRPQFIEDYCACSRRINDYIDSRLAQFQSAAAELIGPVLVGRPQVVEVVLNLHTTALKDLVNRFVFATSRVGDPGLRKLVADALPDMMSEVMAALSELDSKNIAREGGQLQ
jgi:hypothetical protein